MTTKLREWAKFSTPPPLWAKVAGGVLLILTIFGVTTTVLATGDTNEDRGRLITIYDEGAEKTILSDATTVEGALEQAQIEIDDADLVEPARDSELHASSYSVNIYRARPVVVIDGTTQIRVITAAQTGRTVAQVAGIELYPEDLAIIENATDILKNGGAGQRVTIKRAFEMELVLYGQSRMVRTQAKTVEEFLEEKGLKLESSDTMNLGLGSKLSYGMTLKIWREGINTVTADEEIPFETETIKDADRPIGFKEVKTPGRNGKRAITYEVEMHSGVETSQRREINSLVLLEPVKQVEIVGIKPGNGLTKSKGVNQFVDSNGVAHRETYYDLPMNVVMRNCGQGGYYTVREDGVKVDRDGYVIIAANLNIYPRCSVIETSVGAGKVYDTGGFASVHPHGWDIATDWSKGDGI